MSDAQMLGGLMSGVTSAFGNVANVVQGIKNWESQENELAHKWRWTEYINQQNMFREDTAVQRRVADLKAAGLSPTLAAGSAAGAGQGPIPSTQASQLNIGNLKNPVHESTQTMQGIMSLIQTQAQTAETQAQTELLKQLKEQRNITNPLDVQSQELANQLAESTLPVKVDTAQQKLIAMEIDNYISEATKAARIQIANQNVEAKTWEIANKELDNQSKKLGIQSQEIQLIVDRLNKEILQTNKPRIIAMVENESIAKAIAIQGATIANEKASYSAKSAAAQAAMDVQNSNFWSGLGMSKDQASMLADVIKGVMQNVRIYK